MSWIEFLWTPYILFDAIIIAFVPRDAKYIADIINNTTLKSRACSENNGIINLLVLAGKLSVKNSIILSKDKENALAMIANIKMIGIAESNKKKDRWPGNTDISGFLIIVKILLKKCKYLFIKFFIS